MKYIIGLCVFVVVGQAVSAQAPKPVGTVLLETTANDIAKEFKDDPEAAKKKYNPNPPKGGAGGAIINLTGMFQGKGTGLITLKNDSGMDVAINVQNVPNDFGRYHVIVSSARFKSINGKTIFLDAGSVEYKRIIGDEKPTRLLIRFGDGTAKDKPMALDKIKPVLEEYGYRWSQEDAAWSRWMKSNKEQAGRIHNARLHNEAQDLLQTVVSLEESVRGPVPGREHGQEQAITM